MEVGKAKQDPLEQFEASYNILQILPLWQLDIEQLTARSLEARYRKRVNDLLQTGWVLLHIYTLIYEQDGVWRERPMAILGLPKKK